MLESELIFQKADGTVTKHQYLGKCLIIQSIKKRENVEILLVFITGSKLPVNRNINPLRKRTFVRKR